MQAAKLACNPLMNILQRLKMRKHASESEIMGQMRRNETCMSDWHPYTFSANSKGIVPEKHLLCEMPCHHGSRTSEEREGASNPVAVDCQLPLFVESWGTGQPSRPTSTPVSLPSFVLPCSLRVWRSRERKMYGNVLSSCTELPGCKQNTL